MTAVLLEIIDEMPGKIKGRPGRVRTLISERFWSHVDIKTEDECWLWKDSVNIEGYGQFALTHTKNVRASRVAFILHYGPILDPEMSVLHKCDIRRCVNPKHLFLGTQLDNMHDMINKGRSKWSRGSDNGMAKLTEEDVIAIRELYKLGFLQKDVAEAFCTDQPTVSKIISGSRWAHITEGLSGS